MGMKWRSYYITAGSETGQLPVGDTDALRQTRSEMLLTACGQLLLDCDAGWQVDTSKCSSLTDYVAIPTASGSKTYPGLFFINSISGCKLFMAYFGDEIRYNGINDFSGNDLLKFPNTYHGGLCISIIPEGSANTFGDPTTSTFIPSDATRICGTFYRKTFNYSTIQYAAAYNPPSGYHYVYWIGATPRAVVTYVNHRDGTDPSLYAPIYATGKIFGDLAHASDSSESQKYGTVCFRNLSGDYEGWATLMYSSISSPYGTGNGIKVPGYSAFVTSSWNTLDTCGAFLNSSGAWINGNNGTNKSTILFTVGLEPLIKKAFDTTGGSSRWVPLAMMVLATDLSTHGVVSGDGFKGYLDTSLFRCAVSTRGQTFDSNSFICLENDYNLIVGWDSSNPPIRA